MMHDEILKSFLGMKILYSVYFCYWRAFAMQHEAADRQLILQNNMGSFYTLRVCCAQLSMAFVSIS